MLSFFFFLGPNEHEKDINNDISTSFADWSVWSRGYLPTLQTFFTSPHFFGGWGGIQIITKNIFVNCIIILRVYEIWGSLDYNHAYSCECGLPVTVHSLSEAPANINITFPYFIIYNFCMYAYNIAAGIKIDYVTGLWEGFRACCRP